MIALLSSTGIFAATDSEARGEKADLSQEISRIPSSPQKPLSGRTVYKRICMACHTLNVWGAPKLGDRNAWSMRIAKGKEALYSSALNGFKRMPARGYCQFCTDAEIRSAVDYLVEKAQPRKKK